MVGGRISRRSVRAQIGWMECLFDTLGRERKRGGEGKDQKGVRQNGKKRGIE